jgi:ACR3 family arsenite transporter
MAAAEHDSTSRDEGLGFFERWLAVWVGLCIVAGIALGKFAPKVATPLDGMAMDVGEAPIVSVPIAVSLFFLGTLFLAFMGPEAVDRVKLPEGLDLAVGTKHGGGVVALIEIRVS